MLIQNTSGITRFFRHAQFSGGSEPNVHFLNANAAVTNVPNVWQCTHASVRAIAFCCTVKNTVDNSIKYATVQ